MRCTWRQIIMARKSSRTLWAAKLKGGSLPVASSVDLPTGLNSRAYRGLVLGIDPSLRGTGLAVVGFAPPAAPRLLFSRTLKMPPRLSMAACLGGIAEAVTQVLDQFAIEDVAMEQTIYVQNFQTAQILGAARGAAIAVPAMRGLPVAEYPPLRVKQSVTGYGRASKEQMGAMIKNLLMLPDHLPFDESDAAGVAVCHAYTVRQPR